MKFKKTALSLVLALSAFATLGANSPGLDKIVTESGGFLSAHPDIRWRQRAVREFKAGEFEEAFKHFHWSAKYADKVSQAFIAEMLWTGDKKITQDKAAAYAWMDLAAERDYEHFVVKREIYWQGLSEAERARAIKLGTQLYAEYGDKVAQARLATKMRIARASITGSRVGAVSNLEITLYGSNGSEHVLSGNHYYQDKYWKPKHYWQWQDQIWKAPPVGTVTVSPLIRSPEADAPKKKQ